MIFHILMLCSCVLAQPLASTYMLSARPNNTRYDLLSEAVVDGLTTVGALHEMCVGSGTESALSALRAELQKKDIYSTEEIDAAVEAARKEFAAFLERQNIAHLPHTEPVDMGDVTIDTITESMRRAALRTLPKENNRTLRLWAQFRRYIGS